MKRCLRCNKTGSWDTTPCPSCRSLYSTKAYRAYRAYVIASQLPCHLCGQPGANSVDHITPLSAGGRHDSTNWAPAHLICNVKKGPGT